MLKKYAEIQHIAKSAPNSQKHILPSLTDDHYPKRPQTLENMCLYDFVRKIDWNHCDASGEKDFKPLVKPRVPNHKLFHPRKEDQTEAYYYSLLVGELLHLEETAEQAFERLKHEGLLNHHDKLQKMLQAQDEMIEINKAREQQIARNCHE